MSSISLYHQTSDGCLSRNSRHVRASEYLLPQIMTAANQFVDSSFNLGIDHWDWDEWMKWERPTAEDLPLLNSEYSSDSRNQEHGMWPLETNHKNLDTFNRVAIDGQYDIDDSTVMSELDLETPDPATPTITDQRGLYPGYSSLTITEESELQDLEMPYCREPIVSTPEEERELSRSPEPATRTRGRKRKLSTKSQDEPDIGDLRQLRKRGHNAIEKRYRTNLNEKIVILQQSVPSLSALREGEVLKGDECDKSREVPEKYGKAVILTRAVEYITHLEDSTERLGREALALKVRVAAFEKLAMAGSIQMSDVAISKASKVEPLRKAYFQQSTQLKAETIKAESTKSKRMKSKKTSAC